MGKRICTTIITLLLCCNFGIAQHSYDSLNKLAMQARSTGEYAEALNLNIELLKIAQKEKDCAREAHALQQVGRIHYLLRDISQALQYSFRAYNMATDCKVDSVTGRTLHFIGSLYQELQKPDSSLYYYNLAKTALEGTGNWKDLSTLYGVLGELHTRYFHNDAEGKKCYDLCETYAVRSGDTVTLAFAYLKKSLFATMRNDCKQGEELARKALALYRKVNLAGGELYAMDVLLFARYNCFDSTIKFLAIEIQEKRDSIFRAQTADKVAKYKTLYETEKTNAENKELVIATHAKNILLAGTIIVSVLLLVVLWFAYNRYRITKENEFEKEKNLLKSQQYKEVLEAEEKERVRIAGELHDSIGQILSTAKMIISVVKPMDKEDEEVLGDSMNLIDRAVKEVRTISHNLMPASLSEFGIKAALKELARNINSAGTIKFNLEMGDEVDLSKNTEVIIYRVIQEIIHNILKHAAATEISLRFTVTEGHNLVGISDNGKGFDTSMLHTSGGIGWKNIFLRVGLLDGTISVNSGAGKGTAIAIRFK